MEQNNEAALEQAENLPDDEMTLAGDADAIVSSIMNTKDTPN